MHSLFAVVAEHHGLVVKVAIGLATQRTTKALVSLLVAAVAHRVVVMPS